MELKPIYTGTGRILNSKYGIIPKLSLTKKDLKVLEQYLDDNKFEWVTVEILKKKEKIEGKPTHYGQIDRYKESQGQGQQQEPAPAQQVPQNANVNAFDHVEDNLPF